jgi:hypothetical protein
MEAKFAAAFTGSRKESPKKALGPAARDRKSAAQKDEEVAHGRFKCGKDQCDVCAYQTKPDHSKYLVVDAHYVEKYIQEQQALVVN